MTKADLLVRMREGKPCYAFSRIELSHIIDLIPEPRSLSQYNDSSQPEDEKIYTQADLLCKNPFPEAVYTHAHQIVHQVVTPGHSIENTADQFLAFFSGDLALTEGVGKTMLHDKCVIR